MDYEWDEDKAAANVRKHSISFANVFGFDWESALVVEDDREDYGEKRYRALGYINARLHALVFTVREDKIRVISLRRASPREKRSYESSIRP